MKKLISLLFIFGFFVVGAQVYAVDGYSTSSTSIYNNTESNITSDSGCASGAIYSNTTGAKCPNVVAPITPTTDSTPRISYWSGKVNQHVDLSAQMWQTDADGVSGADIDKLTYCKKWYPKTTSVVEYKNETINAWHDGGNVNDYQNIRMSYRCAETTIDLGCANGQVYSSTTGTKCLNNSTPSITVLSPNGGEVYQTGQQIMIKWKTENILTSSTITVEMINNDTNESVLLGDAITLNGSVVLRLPLNTNTWQNNKIKLTAINSKDGGVFARDLSDNFFTITTDNGCSNGAMFSSITGAKCLDNTTPSITVLSPNGGEVYKVGDVMNIKWNGCDPYRNKKMSIFLTDPKLIYPVTELNIARDVPCNNNVYSYKIPSSIFGYGITTILDGSTYKLWISDGTTGGTSGQDISNNYFTINSTDGLLAGCTSTSGYSSTTGVSCGGSQDLIDTGCSDGDRFSKTTGQLCGVINTNNTTKRTLRWGLIGDDVKALQEFLGIYADGVYGRGTASKVKEWQASQGLYADGVFGNTSRQTAGLE